MLLCFSRMLFTLQLVQLQGNILNIILKEIYIRLKTDLFNKSVKTDLLNKSVLVQLLPNSRPSLQD